MSVIKMRNLIITINNPALSDWVTLQVNLENGTIAYAMYQLESGLSGTNHIQGYLEFSSPKTLKQLKNMFPTGHIECRKGTQQQAIAYCSKVETRIDGPFEHGLKKEQGHRTDLANVAFGIQESKNTIAEIAMEFPTQFLKYHGGIAKLITLTMKPRSEPPKVWWIHGDTGTGKSKFVSLQEGSKYWKPLPSRWWDGYAQEEIIILDDLRKDCMKYHELLRLLDRYPLKGETKGGWIEINSGKIMITSCFSPQDFYNGREDIAQLLRRISYTIALEKL